MKFISRRMPFRQLALSFGAAAEEISKGSTSRTNIENGLTGEEIQLPSSLAVESEYAAFCRKSEELENLSERLAERARESDFQSQVVNWMIFRHEEAFVSIV